MLRTKIKRLALKAAQSDTLTRFEACRTLLDVANSNDLATSGIALRTLRRVITKRATSPELYPGDPQISDRLSIAAVRSPQNFAEVLAVTNVFAKQEPIFTKVVYDACRKGLECVAFADVFCDFFDSIISHYPRSSNNHGYIMEHYRNLLRAHEALHDSHAVQMLRHVRCFGECRVEERPPRGLRALRLSLNTASERNTDCLLDLIDGEEDVARQNAISQLGFITPASPEYCDIVCNVLLDVLDEEDEEELLHEAAKSLKAAVLVFTSSPHVVDSNQSLFAEISNECSRHLLLMPTKQHEFSNEPAP